MKVINKDNIEEFKKKNKIKEWVNYLFYSFIALLIGTVGILLVIALLSSPVIFTMMFTFEKHFWMGFIGIVIYLCVLGGMIIAIDDKIKEDKRRW